MNSKLKIVTTVDGAYLKDIHHNIVSHTLHEEYDVYTNEQGVTLTELPVDIYTVTSTYTKDGIIYDSQINTITVKAPTEGYINVLEVKLNSCGETVLLDKTCKYFHHDPYMTPNNYDLYFDYNNIPANIITESPSDLHMRLQSCLPLDKILHLNLDTESEEHGNNIHIQSNVFLNYTSRIINADESNIFNPRIICDWNDDMLLEYLFEMEEHSLIKCLNDKKDLLGLENINIDEEELYVLVSNAYNGGVLDSDLINLFDTSLDILNMTQETIIHIGRIQTGEDEPLEEWEIGGEIEGELEYPEPSGLSDIELSIIGRDYIESVRDDFVSESLVILSQNITGFHKSLSVDLFEDNVLIFSDLVLDKDNNYTNSLDEAYGISYIKGVLNVVDTEELSGVVYQDGGLSSDDNLNFTYTIGVLETPSQYDRIRLHVYKTRSDESILDYELKRYNISFSEYKFYTCNECGKVVYSDTPLDVCSECEGVEFTASDTPYHVYIDDYSNKYYSNERLKVL